MLFILSWCCIRVLGSFLLLNIIFFYCLQHKTPCSPYNLRQDLPAWCLYCISKQPTKSQIAPYISVHNQATATFFHCLVCPPSQGHPFKGNLWDGRHALSAAGWPFQVVLYTLPKAPRPIMESGRTGPMLASASSSSLALQSSPLSLSLVVKRELCSEGGLSGGPLGNACSNGAVLRL